MGGIWYAESFYLLAMVDLLSKENDEILHKHFYDIIDYLQEGDVLVINDSKVIPARLYGHAEGREEALLELLLLRQHPV